MLLLKSTSRSKTKSFPNKPVKSDFRIENPEGNMLQVLNVIPRAVNNSSNYFVDLSSNLAS